MGDKMERRRFLMQAVSASALSLGLPGLTLPNVLASTVGPGEGGVIIPPGVAPSVFSEIIQGKRPCHKIYEDEYTFSFLSRDEIRLGHTLVVPRIQIDKFWEVPEPYYRAVFAAAKKISKAILIATGCERVGTLISGYEIPHFHYHLVPMHEERDLRDGELYRPNPKELRQIQTRIVAALREL